MRALYSAFFSHFGLPRQLHSDQGGKFEVDWWQSSARLRVLTKRGPRRFTLGLMARPRGRIGRFYRCSALNRCAARVMARSPARTVGGISYNAALSDGHQPQHGHDGAGNLAAGFSHSAAAGEARRNHDHIRGRFSPKHAQGACVRSHRDQPRCENSKELFRQVRQETSVRTKSVSVALFPTPFVAQ